MYKGVTPVVATVLLMTITIGAAGTLYTIVGDNIDRASNTNNEIDLNIDGISAENCYVEDNNTHLVMRNSLSETINVSEMSLLLNGQLKNKDEFSFSPSLVEPQKSFEIEIDALIGSQTQILMTDGDQDFSHNCINLGETQLFETSFEDSDPEWYSYTTNRPITTSTTSAKDESSVGQQSLKAKREEKGVGGYGGMARDFNTDYDILELDFKAKAKDELEPSWGRTAIMIKENGNHHVLWQRSASGNGYETDWQTQTFNISEYPEEFTLIIGNNDDSSYSDNHDHDWTIWADDIELAKTS